MKHNPSKISLKHNNLRKRVASKRRPKLTSHVGKRKTIKEDPVPAQTRNDAVDKDLYDEIMITEWESEGGRLPIY